jgi:hypothetical protein
LLSFGAGASDGPCFDRSNCQYCAEEGLPFKVIAHRTLVLFRWSVQFILTVFILKKIGFLLSIIRKLEKFGF